MLCSATFIISNQLLTVTTYTLEYNNLPKSFDGYKIIHLSDLHSKQFGKDNKKLINLITKQSPDIVVMTGDMVNTTDNNLDVFVSTAQQLADRFDTYYIVGNHEQNLAKDKLSSLYQALKNSGVHVLDNNKKSIQKGSEKIDIYGLL